MAPTHCKRGHDMTDAYRDADGFLHCRSCADAARRRYRERKGVVQPQCACGCGQPLKQRTRNGVAIRFVHGHNGRGRSRIVPPAAPAQPEPALDPRVQLFRDELAAYRKREAHRKATEHRHEAVERLLAQPLTLAEWMRAAAPRRAA